MVAGHRARVGAVDVATGHQYVSRGKGGIGVAATRHLHGCTHLPSVGGGQVALSGGQQTFYVAATNGVQPPTAGCQREMSAPLTHTGQVEPGVKARIISGGGRTVIADAALDSRIAHQLPKCSRGSSTRTLVLELIVVCFTSRLDFRHSCTVYSDTEIIF